MLTYLESIFELVDDWTGWAEIAVTGLNFGGFFKVTLRLQVVLERGHNMATVTSQGCEFSFGLGLVGQGRVG